MSRCFAFAFEYFEAVFGRDVVIPHERTEKGEFLFVSDDVG
jgi:hypothetical protein